MKLVNTSSKIKFVKQIKDELKKTLSAAQAKEACAFVDQAFVGVFAQEFQGRKLVDVVGSIVSCWKFVQQFEGKRAKVRMINPSIKSHGWESPNTILVILQKNMPFIVDSVRIELAAREVKIHTIQHSTIEALRDKKGELLSLAQTKNKAASIPEKESIMIIELDRHVDEASMNALRLAIEDVLTEVTSTVTDYPKMSSHVKKIKQELAKGLYKSVKSSEQKEAAEFLDWVSSGNFAFLGYVEYKIEGNGKKQSYTRVKNSALGTLKGERHQSTIDLNKISTKAKENILAPQLMTFAKSSNRSRVHRPAYPDYISIKNFDESGKVRGEQRFLGLYTAKAYSENPQDIPLLRQKIQTVLKKSGLNPFDYSGKELMQLLAVYPRDELFQIDVGELFDVVMEILFIQERNKIRLFMREDAFGRFVTCLVYVPKEIYNTRLRLKIQELLMDDIGGTGIDFNTLISESSLARTQFHIRTESIDGRKLNVSSLEQKIIEMAQSWQEGLEAVLTKTYKEDLADNYLKRYRNAFSNSYKETFSSCSAAADIRLIDEVNRGRKLSMSFYRAEGEQEHVFHFKLFHAENAVPLSDVIPIFEHMGFRVVGENPFEIVDADKKSVWLHDFVLTTAEKTAIDIDKIQENFEELFWKVWAGEAENDFFNRLVISAYMNWREIAILRSYARYMRQIRAGNSQDFISNTVVAHVDITRLLIQIFQCRFDPARELSPSKMASKEASLSKAFYESLDRVQNLTEDKILRLYLDLIKATMRTNYYQLGKDGSEKSYISFKFQPRLIPNVPPPVPMFEIFVYSPRIEGVHLRGGKVARGGLRWSDRYEDYRTEVLGLVKAQQVKNAVIVPVGAKGGFVAKMLPDGDRDAFMKEGIACYQTFITGLLDVTDNLIDGKVVPPKNVVRHDEDDFYLVVAADKGTATFSDIANEISINKGHWLGDAFASGGSQGYDHKKMGITARGAWVSVERHFREMGHNTRTTPFSVIGIGDMAGDVFGNGMLLSPFTQLVAAFNHLHIFLDPNPNPQRSFEERKRLFDLPRSSWEDYSKKLISKGGGIYSRSAKSIPLSPQIQSMLGTDEKSMPPNQLITCILKSHVDLLWIGGIGTYVKSSSETHADVGDKANDILRINGRELNVKVVGEGGNLGMTQLSRIEYSRNGGRLNTDFIDNAAGVDCSDHEVNIKILLSEIQTKGELTEKQRNELLVKMTQSVAGHVLENNYRQTQAISIACRDSLARMEEYRRLINEMESSGKLNRALEFIPDDEAITERKSMGEGLTRPELSVLISYVKGDLKEVLNDSDFPDDPGLARELDVVFPPKIVKQYGQQLRQHRLRREIISTQIANDMVNHMGFSFVDRLRQSTGATPGTIAMAYLISREIFSLEHWWNAIEALDYTVSSECQMMMMGKLMSLVRRSSRWLIRNRRSKLNVTDSMEDLTKGISQIAKALPKYLTGVTKEAWQSKQDNMVEQGVPKDLAATIASSSHLYAALGIIEAQESTGQSLNMVANVYYALGSRLDLTWFGQQINGLTPVNHWQASAREAFREDLDWQQRALTVGLLNLDAAPSAIEKRIDFWVDQHKGLVDRWLHTLTDFKANADAEFPMYSVALRELLDLAQSTVHATPG